MEVFGRLPLLIFSLLFHHIFGVDVTLNGQPATIYGRFEGTAVLSCFVANHTDGTVWWNRIVGGNRTEIFQIDPGGNYTRADFVGTTNNKYSLEVDPVNSADYWANMTISSVENDDQGNYSCSTEPNFDEVVVELIRAEIPSDLKLPSSGFRIEVIEGVAYTMTCTAYDSKPQVSMQWTIDSSSVAEDYSNFTKDSDGTFTTISYMTYTYTHAVHQGKKVDCFAFNVAGDLKSETILDVQFAASITNKDDNNVYADEGGKAVLRCEGEGNPPPEFTWVNSLLLEIPVGEDNIDIVESDPEGFNISSTLTIASVDPERDFGKYTCNVLNPLGDDTLEIYLSQKTVPGPATDVNVTNATDTELTVTWVEGRDGGHPQAFTVEYRVGGTGADWEDSQAVDQPPVTLNDLQPQTQYEIRVRSNNTLGFVHSESPYFTYYTTGSTIDPRIGVDNSPIIIGVCVGGMLLVVIILLVVLMIFRSKRGKDKPQVELEMRQHGANNAAFVNDYSPPEDPRKSIYAEVVKNGGDKPKKSNGTTTSSFYSEEAEEAPQVPPPFIREGEELVEYENALGKRPLSQGNPFPEDSPYETTGQPLEEKRRDPDGLVYADLDLQTPPKAISGGQPKPQNGETSYASIDFSQRPKSNGTLAQAAL